MPQDTNAEAERQRLIEKVRLIQKIKAQQRSAPDSTRAPSMPWKEVGKQALSNLPASFGNLVMGQIQGAAAGQQALSGNVMPAISLGQGLVESKKRTYGSMEGFKETLATDPLAVPADILAVAGGTGRRNNAGKRTAGESSWASLRRGPQREDPAYFTCRSTAACA